MQALLFPESLVCCPNTGLRYLPGDYPSVLDEFYKQSSQRRKNYRNQDLWVRGRLLTTDQFINGEDKGKKKGLGVSVWGGKQEVSGSDEEQQHFCRFDEKHVDCHLTSGLLRDLPVSFRDSLGTWGGRMDDLQRYHSYSEGRSTFRHQE